MTLLSQVAPYKLPRVNTSPISVFVAGRVTAPSGGVPSQLKRLEIKVNRHAVLQSRGLPTCRLSSIRAATSAAAMRACGSSLVGSGQFWAHIVLPEQGSYPTRGRLLIFNGTRRGARVLYAHIYTSDPFSTSFVVPFELSRIGNGPYGIKLSASLPEALGEWGYVDRIKLNLSRRYRHDGKRLSYLNASCPAPSGINRAGYSLAFATFTFASARIGVGINKVCGVWE